VQKFVTVVIALFILAQVVFSVTVELVVLGVAAVNA
jgi:hypothetical protein